jgi:hypothetical protein
VIRREEEKGNGREKWVGERERERERGREREGGRRRRAITRITVKRRDSTRGTLRANV